MRYRRGILGACLGIASCLATAQDIEQFWRQTGPITSSAFSAAFVKANGTIYVEIAPYSNGIQSIVCRKVDGSPNWTYPLPAKAYVQSILTTNDNLIYITVYDGAYYGHPYVLALDQDGQFVWRYNYYQGNSYRQLSEMRIFGDKLLVVGNGRTGIFGTDPRLVVLSLNRFAGTLNYGREYSPGNSNMPNEPSIRSNGTYAYVKGLRYDGNGGTGVLKLDPTTGDVLGTYAVGPFFARNMEVDSQGSIYLSGNVNYQSGIPELRKVNGAGTGAMPLIYRKTVGSGQFVLSQGSVYIQEYSYDGTNVTSYGLRKLRASDGVSLWFRPFPTDWTDRLEELRADAAGKLFAFRFQNDTVNSKMGIQQVDPATGNDIGLPRPFAQAALPYGGVQGRSMVMNGYGEIFAVGSEEPQSSQTVSVSARFFQRPQAFADSYTVVQGDLFTTSGNGLFVNDKFTNPALTAASVVAGMGPEKGLVTMTGAGDFTYLARDGSTAIPVGTQTFRYRSTRGAFSSEAQVTLNVVRGVSSLALSRYTVAGAASVGGTVDLSSAGGATVVNLSQSSPYITMPTSVTIGSGKTRGTFILNAVPVPAVTVVPITASFNGTSKIVNLTLQPLQVASFTVSPTAITAGGTFGVQIKLNGRAGVGGVAMDLSADKIYVTTPGPFTIPEGQISAGFTLPTVNPSSNTSVLLTLSGLGNPLYRVVTVRHL